MLAEVDGLQVPAKGRTGRLRPVPGTGNAAPLDSKALSLDAGTGADVAAACRSKGLQFGVDRVDVVCQVHELSNVFVAPVAIGNQPDFNFRSRILRDNRVGNRPSPL